MRQLRYHPPYFIYACIIMAITSCNAAKRITTNNPLYTGAGVTFENVGVENDPAQLNESLKKDLLKISTPIPNSRILGFRYRLALFNLFNEPKKKTGIVHMIKHKWGEDPVLLSETMPAAISKRMEDKLFSMGYLRPAVHHNIITTKNAAMIEYLVNPGSRYSVARVRWPDTTSKISTIISSDSSNTLILKGSYLGVDLLSAERERIDRHLKDNGYYYFSPDNLLFKIDTLHNGQAEIYVTLKANAGLQSMMPWRLGTITVYPDYLLEKDSILKRTSPVFYKGLSIIDKPKKTYSRNLIRRTIVMNEGAVYERRLHNLTIERLMNLNTLKFVRVSFDPDTALQVMNTKIAMTRTKERSIRLDISGNSKSNNFVGSELSLSERNDNLFKEAVIVELRMNVGLDAQVGGKNQLSNNAYTYKSETNVFIPKILLPFTNFRFPNSSYLPRTLISLARESLSRTDLYTVNSLNFSFGYSWKNSKTREHSFRLFNVTRIDPRNITATFEKTLDKDPLLKASFEKQLMMSTTYDFKINNTYQVKKRITFAFTSSVTTAGNIATLLTRVKSDTPNARTLAGLPLSQFVRAQFDLRGYHKLGENIIWANRFIAGIAYAYKNSITVPYTQQFLIGGSSDFRAFRARTLGPGSYHTDQSVYEANQSGDIKVELNSELRVSLSKFIKIAAFTDAGNIWTRNDGVNEPGSGLSRGDFFKEMALGAGIGIRFDASFFLLRFDIAAPLRKPWYPEGKRWVLNELDIWDKQWRRDNLILNIGIGYPF